MDRGFRRSGQIIYQPICANCRQCVQMRVPVNQFSPDKSQRRAFRRNSDLIVTTGPPTLTDEKADLYKRYLADWHDQPGDNTPETLRSFLYESPVNSREFCYRDPSGELLAVGIADISPSAFSSVYFYFNPAQQARSLGTFGAVYELNWCRDMKIAFYYLGYWVKDCRKMQYKVRFKPSQILGPDGNWTWTT